jgi:hypothetical protein
MVRVAKSNVRSVCRTESVSSKPGKSASSSSVDSAKLEGYIRPAQRVAEGQLPRRARTRAVAGIAQWYKEHPKGVDQSTTSAGSAHTILDHALFAASNSDSSEDHTWVSTGSHSRTSSPSASHSSRSSGGSSTAKQRTSGRPSTSHKKHSAKGTRTAHKKIVSRPPSQPTVASIQGDEDEPSSTAEKPKKMGKLVARAIKSESDSDEDERASSRSVSRAASPSLSSSTSASAVTRSSTKGKKEKTVKLLVIKSTEAGGYDRAQEAGRQSLAQGSSVRPMRHCDTSLLLISCLLVSL